MRDWIGKVNVLTPRRWETLHVRVTSGSAHTAAYRAVLAAKAQLRPRTRIESLSVHLTPVDGTMALRNGAIGERVRELAELVS
jgi:hypothetical protein